MRLQFRIDGGVSEFPRNRQTEECVPRCVLEARPILAGLAYWIQSPPAQTFRCGLEEQSRFVAFLGQELERQSQSASWTYSVVVVNQRIIVHGEGVAEQTLMERKIVGLRILPPIVEYPMHLTAVKDVMEPQPEAGCAQSGGPNLRVLTVHAFG